MRSGTIGLLAACCTLFFWSRPPPDYLIAVFLTGGLLFGVASLRFSQSNMLLRSACVLACGFLAGAGYLCWRLAILEADRLPPAVLEKPVIIEGRVTAMPATSTDVVRFDMAARIVGSDPPTGREFRVRLGWYFPPAALRAGERWRLQVQLKPAHGSINLQNFDYERWLYARGILVTGSVRKSGENRRLEEAGIHWQGWRQSLDERLALLTRQLRHAGIMRALVIGEKDQIGEASWQSFNASGTNHLIAISGLHISLVAGLVFLLARAAMTLLPWRRNREIPAAILAWLAAAGYSLLAGFALPTRRALLMLGVLLLARLARRHISSWDAWWLALTAVLLLDPFAVLGPGLWLSFGAVALIFAILGGRVAGPGNLAGTVRLQAGLSFGLLPLLTFWFARIPLLSGFCNLFSVPLFGLLVVPLIFLGLATGLVMPAAGQSLLTLADWILSGWLWLINLIVGAADQIPVRRSLVSWLTVLLALAAMLLLVPAVRPVKTLAVLFVALAVAGADRTREDGRLHLYVLDVGHGSSVLVSYRGRHLLYDTGAENRHFSATERWVLPSLRALGVNRLDLLVISHGDLDHAGGLQRLRRELPVDRILVGTGVPLDPPVEPCRQGQSWRWQEVGFRILHPDGRRYSNNDGSCVLQILYGQQRILLAGDIQQRAERKLVDRYGAELAAGILLAPHHGSNTSSGQAFVERVRPRWVIYSAGFRHRFRFPRPEVVQRYRRFGSRQLSSACEGMLHFTLTPREAWLTGLRRHNPYLWRYQCP